MYHITVYGGGRMHKKIHPSVQNLLWQHLLKFKCYGFFSCQRKTAPDGIKQTKETLFKRHVVE